jgi:hypothetical protein
MSLYAKREPSVLKRCSSACKDLARRGDVSSRGTPDRHQSKLPSGQPSKGDDRWDLACHCVYGQAVDSRIARSGRAPYVASPGGRIRCTRQIARTIGRDDVVAVVRAIGRLPAANSEYTIHARRARDLSFRILDTHQIGEPTSPPITVGRCGSADARYCSPTADCRACCWFCFRLGDGCADPPEWDRRLPPTPRDARMLACRQGARHERSLGCRRAAPHANARCWPHRAVSCIPHTADLFSIALVAGRSGHRETVPPHHYMATRVLA